MELDLTLVKVTNARAAEAENARNIIERNQKARQYIKSKESKLEKIIDKIIPFMFGLSLLSLIIAMCVVEIVHYNVFGTLL